MQIMRLIASTDIVIGRHARLSASFRVFDSLNYWYWGIWIPHYCEHIWWRVEVGLWITVKSGHPIIIARNCRTISYIVLWNWKKEKQWASEFGSNSISLSLYSVVYQLVVESSWQRQFRINQVAAYNCRLRSGGTIREGIYVEFSTKGI